MFDRVGAGCGYTAGNEAWKSSAASRQEGCVRLALSPGEGRMDCALKSEFTLKELADKLGSNKKVHIICNDENGMVLYFSKHQKELNGQDYSFDAGM